MYHGMTPPLNTVVNHAKKDRIFARGNTFLSWAMA